MMKKDSLLFLYQKWTGRQLSKKQKSVFINSSVRNFSIPF